MWSEGDPEFEWLDRKVKRFEMCRKASPIVRCCIETVRWIPVLFVVAVLCWAYYAYVYQLCINSVESAGQRVVYLAVFHVLLLLFLASYYQTVFSPIGQPPRSFFLDRETLDDLNAMGGDERRCNDVLQRFVTMNRLPVHTRSFDGMIRYCPKCRCVKPDRAHHCSICSQCVLKFDHHCPWVNTCVNFRNYKFFLLFLFWGLVLCLWGFATDAPYFIDFWRRELREKMEGAGKFHVLFLFFVSGMFAISLSCLFFYHLYLTARNRSTVESFRPPVFAHGPDKHAFNIGCALNYQQVFGTNKLFWPLPIYTSLGDGLRFGREAMNLRLLESGSGAGTGGGGGVARAERLSLLHEAMADELSDATDSEQDDILLPVVTRPAPFHPPPQPAFVV